MIWTWTDLTWPRSGCSGSTLAQASSAHACSALAEDPKPFKARGGAAPPLPCSHLGPRPMLSMHELSLSMPEPMLSMSMLILAKSGQSKSKSWLTQSRPKVGQKLAQSRPKVGQKSSQSRPKVGPKSNQKFGISTTGPSAEIPDLADRSALMRECHCCRFQIKRSRESPKTAKKHEKCQFWVIFEPSLLSAQAGTYVTFRWNHAWQQHAEVASKSERPRAAGQWG